jgi:hypothetical protein
MGVSQYVRINNYTKLCQNRNPPSRRIAREERENNSSLLCLSCEDYWDPSWHKEFGVRESRTSGQADSQKRHELLLLRYSTGSMEKVLSGINISSHARSIHF